jgi:hypothetical protein
MNRRKRGYDDDGKCDTEKTEIESSCNWTRFFVFLGGGGGGGGGFRDRSKRRRTSETLEIEDRLESLILRVGEKVRERERLLTSGGR